jgi:hypothetical protein
MVIFHHNFAPMHQMASRWGYSVLLLASRARWRRRHVKQTPCWGLGVNERGSLTRLPDPEGPQSSMQQNHRARQSGKIGHGREAAQNMSEQQYAGMTRKSCRSHRKKAIAAAVKSQGDTTTGNAGRSKGELQAVYSHALPLCHYWTGAHTFKPQGLDPGNWLTI